MKASLLAQWSRVRAPLLRSWRLARQFVLRASAARGPRNKSVLFAGILAIVVWQMGFNRLDAKIDDHYQLTAASGMHNDQTFVYFYWYENLFPVASTLAVRRPCHYRCDALTESAAPAELSKPAADKVLHDHPDTLVMDLSWTWYAGDRGKVFLYMLDTWLKGAPFKPSVKPFHRFVFITALAALFAAFWRERRPWLGALAVLLVGSDPFQVFEVHGHDNVFGWNITTATLVLAIYLPFLVGRRLALDRAWIWPVSTGILIATIRTFRSEPMPIIAAIVLALAQARFVGAHAPRRVWLYRAGLVALFFATFTGAGAAWHAYFEHKNEEARATLTRLGGHPMPGPMRMYHHFWHPVWCGLGDFDTKYGYAWDDEAAVRYAAPILRERFHEYVPTASFFRSATKNLDEYWDADGVYKKQPYDIPNYNEVIRDKVLADIRKDPKWYIGILWKRAWRVLEEATPVRLTTWRAWHELPGTAPGEKSWPGKAFLLLLSLGVLLRARFFVNLLLFTLPTVTTAMIVYSDRGISWYGIFHLLGVVVLFALALELARRLAQRAEKRVRSEWTRARARAD